MEDIGLPPFESTAVEVWIQRELKNRKEPASVADHLLKQWEKGFFTVGAKKTAGQFCFQNGFFPSLLRILRTDILTNAPIPWALLFKVVSQFENPVSKDTCDACLTGASREMQLHSLAAEALALKDPDPRWQKVFSAEIQERSREALTRRKKMIDELKIFRHEGMDSEVREGVTKLLAVFPEDPDGQTFAKYMGQKDIEKTLHRLRQTYAKPVFKASGKGTDENTDWPELAAAMGHLAQKTDLESSYNLSIGLHEMGLNRQALDVLRWSKKDWTVREDLWELEILVSLGFFAEVLNSSQIILHGHTEVEVVRAALYFSAHAYFGLNDPEQATSILKGLIEHDPHYRDASILLSEWSDGSP